jgi:magnesium-protoporphyrin O-methyltransferase
MNTVSYLERRSQLEAYFDRTAADAWSRLTSDAPVSRVRATVRAGRNRMRQTLLGWLPEDLRGLRLLDAGCGTGALAVEAARRGARVLAIDLSPTLVDLARERSPEDLGDGSIEFRVGDMLNPAFDREHFDYAVAMDSLIHYQAADVIRVLSSLSRSVSRAVLFTFAPRTPALSLMHAAGKLFPRGNRSPAIEPVAERRLLGLIDDAPALAPWRAARSERIMSGFYTSQALELARR